MKKTNLIKTIMIAVAVIAVLLVGIFLRNKAFWSYEPVSYPVYGFANMRGEEGIVYKGIGGVYGQELPLEASTFAVRGDKLYYAGQIKEDYVVSEERTGTICESLLDGSAERVLVEDAYNLGFGQEKLIGDKIFYPNGMDEEYHTRYAWYDLLTGECSEITSTRIGNIFGYDGTCLFYSGYDAKNDCNIVGKYHLGKKKDKLLFSYKDADEAGGIISLHYYDGAIYAMTLVEEMQDYDARTAVYRMQIHSAGNGRLEEELLLELTGSANYGFLYAGDELYFSTAQDLCMVTLPKRSTTEKTGQELTVTRLAGLSEKEYWGIPHFAPGDGYLYYETIADIDEVTGMNDYFYRVPLTGGEPELLASWFTN